LQFPFYGKLPICPFSGGEEAKPRPYGNQKIAIGEENSPPLSRKIVRGANDAHETKTQSWGTRQKNTVLKTGHCKPGERQGGVIKSPLQRHKHRPQQGQISTSD